MGYHNINLLRLTVKLDSILAIFVAAEEGLFILVWPLRGVLLGLILECFALLRRFCLALAGAALIGVGWQGGL